MNLGFTALDRRKNCIRRALIFLALFATIFACNPTYASSFIIAPTYGSTITSDPNAATIEATINSTIGVYEATFTDPITVRITFQEMNSGLGQSSTFFDAVSYSSYLTALTADAKSTNDAIALAHLGAGPNNPVNGNANINVKLPNLRAVGIMESPPLGQPDGTVGLNTSIMNLSRTGLQDSSKYDLMAVVSHEINEVLGLGSALPTPQNGTIFPEDLFRYSSALARNFTTSGDNAYFSIDGTHDLARFNQSGGGTDYGDWWSTGAHTPQVQDAFGTPGAQPNLGVEVTALDVIGYDVAPEPGTVILLGTGLVIAGLRGRRGRQAR